MQKEIIWCGIDVSKDTMTVAVDLHPDKNARSNPAWTFPRSKAGVAKMKAWICEQLEMNNQANRPFRFLMEATGVYSRELLLWLLEVLPESRPTVMNPRLVKNFIASLGATNKTDDLDSKYIARMGTERNPDETLLTSPELRQLQELIRNRDFLVTSKTALDACQSTLTLGGPSYSANERISVVMMTEIKKLNAEIANLLETNLEMQESVRIMSTFPGFAMISACTVLSEVGPFTEEFSRTQVSAFSGLAPILSHSGTSVHSSRISKRGSALLRKNLYLVSNHAIKKVPELTALYNRIIAQGKRPMTAKCACMRKILLMVRSMVINKKDYDPQYQAKKRTRVA